MTPPLHLTPLAVFRAASLALIAGLGAATALAQEETSPRVEYSIAIHGGAGVIAPGDEEMERQYREALEEALEIGRAILEDGGTALDAVEQAVIRMEDDPLFNAGRGSVFTNAGTNELDASIMDGRDRDAGAVAGVRTVKNPISLARLVMTETRHVLLAADGADRFAEEMEVEQVEPEYFYVERRWQQLQRARERDEITGATEDEDTSTVGAAALDRHGNLAAATSTGGLTNKRFGRVGDSPIPGAGTWADNATCAVSGTGRGEIFIRHTVASRVGALMEYRGLSIQEAMDEVVFEVMPEGTGGVIGVSADGEIGWAYNGRGMYRGGADSTGRFEIAIWEE